MARRDTGGGMLTVVALGAAGAAGTALYLTRKKGDETPGDGKTDVTPPGDDKKDVTPPGPHKTIGHPFVPGFANEAANAATACKHRPIVHPAGVAAQTSGMSAVDWLTTVAFLETYPNAPVDVASLSSRPLQEAWLRIRAYVRACLKTPDVDKDSDKDKDKDVGPKSNPTFGPPYGVGRGAEHRNVELACERKPVKHPNGQVRKKHHTDADWAANIAYWEAYPSAPVRLSSSDSAEWRRAWMRMHGYAKECLKAGTQDKDKDDVGPKVNPTIGSPFGAGVASERRNAELACEQRPGRHPNGQSGNGSDPNWLANIAYWEAHPKGPITLSASDPQDRLYRSAWKRIKRYVDVCISKSKDPKVEPDDKAQNPVLGPPYQSGRSHERANARIACKYRPLVHPNGQRKLSSQSINDWLANITYWETNPRYPILLASDSPRQQIDAWKRARALVDDCLKTAGTNPETPKTDPPKKKPKLIGHPYGQGRAAEIPNAQYACKLVPVSHPNGRRKGTSRIDYWLANIAYWEAHPDYPLGLQKSSPKRYRDAWTRSWRAVKACLADRSKIPERPSKPSKSSTASEPKGADERTIGSPFSPGVANIKRNAVFACSRRPLTHPNGRGNASDENWLANITYWETFPSYPVKLQRSSPKSQKAAWVRARKEVRACMRAASTRTSSTSRPTAPPVPTKPTRSVSKLASPGKVPAPDVRTAKSDISGATEKRNAAIAVVERPVAFKGRGSKKRKQKWPDWLSNVALWTTYPDAPTKLSAKDDGHERYIAAWKRIRADITGMDTVKRKLGPSPLGTDDDANWTRWALAMWASSDLRTPAALRDAYLKASRYLTETEPGKAVVRRDVGRSAGPVRVTPSGLVAEAARRVSTGKLSTVTNWTQSPSRAFWVANTLY